MTGLYRYCLWSLLMLVSLPAMANLHWADAATASKLSQEGRYRAARQLSLDMPALAAQLSSAPLARGGYAYRTSTIAESLQLPMPDGSMRAFRVYESPVMEHELARKFPQIKSYKVFAVDDSTVSGRLGLGPKGFHGYLNTEDGVVFIDPLPGSGTNQYISYYKKDYTATPPDNFSCGARREPAQSPVDSSLTQVAAAVYAKTSNEMLSYRIAVATTGEYSLAVDPGMTDKADVLAEVVTAINRVNQIYERDLAIHLDLVANNDQLIYLDPANDPYTNNNAIALLTENQANIDSVIGSANYDIGHVFNTAGGGLAAFEVVCVDAGKARAESGLANPVNDPFYIDLVAHEIGHQFGADHTFNGTSGACANNRNATTAFEPGSGTTIMSYAGICDAENIASAADATFHGGSIEQMVSFSRQGAGNTCDVQAATGNTAPAIVAPASYTIPALTPFTLDASATDTELDPLSYQWDQMDAGNATTAATLGDDLCSNALFRSYAPAAASSRTFPNMPDLLAGTASSAETLPATSRELNFRLTVRDGNGGVNEADVLLTVDGNSGPFSVLQPNTAVTLETTQPQVIEWNSACTEQAPVSCNNVDILLSTDGGSTFTSLVGGSTPNDGDELVNITPTTSSTARIKIQCVGNVFFDISDVDFSLVQDGSGSVLALTGNGGSSSCNQSASCAVVSSGFDQEPNNSMAQAVSISLPLTITGVVNNLADANDYYVFVASTSAYTFTLSDYAGNDLDLYLLDSSGNIISESSSLATTETISLGLASGETYFIVVNAYETADMDAGYTLTITESAPAPPPGDDGGALGPWLPLLLLLVIVARSRPAAARISGQANIR